jgi:hypothetical protein
MPDVATINKAAREFLDGRDLEYVDLQLPYFKSDRWFVPVTFYDRLLGNVVLDKEGTVIPVLSYPNRR